MKKKMLALGLVATMVASVFTGCGKKDESAETGKSGPSYVYVGSFEKLAELTENEAIRETVMVGDNIYYLKTIYDEENGNVENVICKTPISGGEVTEVSLEFLENAYIQSLCVGKDDSLVCVENVYDEDSYEEQYYIQIFNANGEAIMTTAIDDSVMKGGEYIYIEEVCCDADGNIYFSDGDSSVYCLDENGKLKFSVSVTYPRSIVAYDKGVYVTGYDSSGDDWSSILCKINAEKGDVEETYKNIPESCESLTYGKDGKLYLNTGSNLYVWNEEKQETELIMNWLDSNIDGSEVDSFSIMDDGSMAVVLQEWEDSGESNISKAVLTKQEVTPENSKKEITFAAYYLDGNLKKQILNFNRSNTEYRIHVKEYSDCNYDEIETLMLADLSSKNAPDLIDLSVLNMTKLANQGYLEDLYPYFNKDFSMDDYQKNVLETNMIDGKMYGLCGSFSVLTTAAKTSNLNGQNEWNINSFKDFITNRPAGTEVFGYTSKDEMLRIFLAFDSDEFIDWKAGTCNFNSQSFKDILEVCNTFPEESEYDEDDESYPSKVQSNKMILFSLGVYDVTEIQVYKEMCEEDITYIGFPVNGTCAPVVVPSGSNIAMSSKCSDKEGAWEFMKTLLSDEYQRACYDMPVKKSIQNEKYDKACEKEYYTNENGEKVEQSKMSYGWDDWSVEIYAATEEDVADCKRLIDSATGSYNDNEELFEMIKEEVAPYFKGQKTVDEVADIIQSRISLYVTENM